MQSESGWSASAALGKRHRRTDRHPSDLPLVPAHPELALLRVWLAIYQT